MMGDSAGGCGLLPFRGGWVGPLLLARSRWGARDPSIFGDPNADTADAWAEESHGLRKELTDPWDAGGGGGARGVDNSECDVGIGENVYSRGAYARATPTPHPILTTTYTPARYWVRAPRRPRMFTPSAQKPMRRACAISFASSLNTKP